MKINLCHDEWRSKNLNFGDAKNEEKKCSSLKSRLATLHYKTKTATRANINQATNTQLKTKTNNLKATIITLASSSSISYEWREECRFSNGTSRWRLHTKSTPTEPIFFNTNTTIIFVIGALICAYVSPLCNFNRSIFPTDCG